MTAPAPITQSTSDLLREMRKEQAPSFADALRQCRDALHDVAIDCAIECQNAEARDTVGSRKAVRVANAAVNVKTLQDALTAADTALAALSEPPADHFAALHEAAAVELMLIDSDADTETCAGFVMRLRDRMVSNSLAAQPLAPAPQPASNTDVRTILIDVVPGPDGMGHEVYAKSVDDVVRVLTELGEKAEELASLKSAKPASALAASAVTLDAGDAERTAYYATYRDYTNKTGHPPCSFDVWLLARGLMASDGRKVATAVADELPASQGEVPMPNPWGYCYVWNSPMGAHYSFSAAHYNGRACDDQVLLNTRDELRAYGDARAAAVREPLSDAPRFLLVATGDGEHNGCVPTFCADEAAVSAALLPLMFFLPPGERLDDDRAEQFKANLSALLEDGFLHFEGDPSIYLFRLAGGITAQAQQHEGGN